MDHDVGKCGVHAGKRMFAQHGALDGGKKPTSSGVLASSTTCRSSRTDPGFHPNRRADRPRQPVISATGMHDFAFLHHSRQVARVCADCRESVLSPSSQSIRSRSACGIGIRVRIGKCRVATESPARALSHGFGVVVFFVGRKPIKCRKAMNRQMAQVMIERLLFPRQLRFASFHRAMAMSPSMRGRIVGTRAVRSAAAPETTARWSACRWPRQLLFSVRMPASSVSMMASFGFRRCQHRTISAAAAIARWMTVRRQALPASNRRQQEPLIWEGQTVPSVRNFCLLMGNSPPSGALGGSLRPSKACWLPGRCGNPS